MPKTLAQHAADAISVQDACNSSGIARSMVEAMDCIRTATPGTANVNRHPIVFMYLYKLMALNGHEPLSMWDEYTAAEAKCNHLATGAPIVDRSACRTQVCTCHDDSAWTRCDQVPGGYTYPNGCDCGCAWSEPVKVTNA